jgi:hypothetical protein
MLTESPRPDIPRVASPLPLPVLYDSASRKADFDPPPTRSFTRPPPPPSVEDEADALAKEYGSPSVLSVAHEEPQSKGDVDQFPVMLEVHEHNPERRFVILTNSSPGSETDGDDKPSSAPTPKKPEVTADTQPSEANIGRKYNAETPRPSSRHHERGYSGQPPLERRKSRQDLPRLDTEFQTEAPSPHHRRARSGTSTSRPDGYPSHQSRPSGDTLLTPDVMKHGTGRREKVYHGYGKSSDGSSRSPVQASQSAVSDSRPRVVDGDYDSRRTGSSAPKRSSTSAEPARPMRRLSNERVGGPRLREDYPIRGSRRDNPRPYERDRERERERERERVDMDKPKSNLNRPPREGGREEHPLGPRMPGARREKTVVVQEQGGSTPAQDRTSEAPKANRPQPRAPTMPIPMPIPMAMPSPRAGGTADVNPNVPTPRSAATFPLADNEDKSRERPVSQLPYPEDDVILMPATPVDFDIDPLGIPTSFQTPPAVPTHGVPLTAPLGAPFNNVAANGPVEIPGLDAAQTYKPPPFDPAREGPKLDLPANISRRHSESAGQAETLPQCPRDKPIAGLSDWLTLPRSDFNICPDCYQAVFANTRFRTQFQPMLRPTDKPIACDFGASPWYRVAWLLVLKNNQVDLRMFHQLASIMYTSRSQPCPGYRRATRNWLTVRDPATQRPARNFTVCYQCAKIVEALLPNLVGVFTPLDARGDPIRATCALHFTPKRRRFVQYFDAFEMVSDRALADGKPPNVTDLAKQLGSLSVGSECREDSPVDNGRWHVMQFLPQFTVCGECFEEVVRPRLGDDNLIARNFYKDPQRLASATCQLYSERMREIFAKACRRDDPRYLEDKVIERQQVEADIHAKLARLDKDGGNEAWVSDQVARLVREWQRWE